MAKVVSLSDLLTCLGDRSRSITEDKTVFMAGHIICKLGRTGHK